MDPDQSNEQSDHGLIMFAYMMKLFWSKFGVILCSILQTVWTKVRMLRSSLISVHSVCMIQFFERKT